MDKKSIILSVCGILVLSAVIAVSVFFLYNDGSFTRNLFGTVRSLEERYTPAPKAMSVKTSKDVVSDVVSSVSQDGKSAVQGQSTKWAVAMMGHSYALEQNSDNVLVAGSIGGEKAWSYPLDGKIAGMMGKVDYYSNGKEQLIFIAGRKLHILSRLGKEVEGFPVDLGTTVILGPDVYDFTGAKRYNILALTKDNTIEMYNLKGEKHKNWKGIRHKEEFVGLPASVVKNGRNYWVARTSKHTVVYPFYGGAPIKEYEGSLTVENVKSNL